MKNLLPHPVFPPVILVAYASFLCCLLLCVRWLAHVQVQHVSRKKLILGSQVEFGSNKCKCRAKEEGQDPPQLGTRERMSWRSNSWCLWCSWVIALAWGVVLWSSLGFHTGFVRSHDVFLLCFNQFLKKCGYAVALVNLLHFFSEVCLAILF